MHLGVNGLRLSGQRFGVGRYIEYLLKYWDRQVSAHEHVTVFVRGDIDVQGLPTSGRVDIRRLAPELTGTLWENGPLRAAARGVDVMFCPSYTAPLTGRTPSIVVTHSVDEARPGTHRWWHNQVRARLYRAAALRSQAVIVPSTETRRAVEQLYGVRPSRVHLVPLGVDTEVFHPLPSESEACREVRRRYLRDESPYLLFVGKMSKRRNVPLLLRAFAELKRRRYPHKLLLFGPNHDGLPLPTMLDELGIAEHVVQDDGRITSHRELLPVYAAADAFVHPTTYDATSLPVLEAFASGLPVITTRTGGLVEVCGGAAVLIDDWSPGTLADAIADVVSNRDRRAALIAAGLERAAEFSWERLASRTLDITRRVAAPRHGEGDGNEVSA